MNALTFRIACDFWCFEVISALIFLLALEHFHNRDGNATTLIQTMTGVRVEEKPVPPHLFL
jgi:hypothetical protein